MPKKGHKRKTTKEKKDPQFFPQRVLLAEKTTKTILDRR